MASKDVVWTLSEENARELWNYLHFHRPGGHQDVHDSLLDAIAAAGESEGEPEPAKTKLEDRERFFYLEVVARRTPSNEVEGSGWFQPEDFAQFLRDRFVVKPKSDYGLDAYNKHSGQLIVDVQVADPEHFGQRNPKTKTKKPVVTIQHVDDETLDVFVGDEYVGGANHDDHGWSGMKAVEETSKKLAKRLGAKIRKV